MVSDWAARPTIRARDIDREYAMGVLRDASVDGQLRRDEFDRRLRLAMNAGTLGELADLIADLQGQQTPPPSAMASRMAHPYAYTPPPSAHTTRRKNAGVVVGIVAVVIAALAGVTVVGTAFVDDEYPALSTEPGDCAGHPEEVFLLDCLSEDNPLAWTDLSSSQFDKLEALGLPGTLPIVDGADFDQRAWQSAATQADDPATTTYRWHLEYLAGDVDGEPPVEPEHVLALYRATVDPSRFGADPRAVHRDDGASGLRWASSDGHSELVVWVRTETTDKERVQLDVRRDLRPAAARPDVLGQHATDVQRLASPTVPGMTYLRSRVSQVRDRPHTCTVEQVWSATPAQYSAVRERVGPGVTAVLDDGELTYTATKPDCLAFDL